MNTCILQRNFVKQVFRLIKVRKLLVENCLNQTVKLVRQLDLVFNEVIWTDFH